MIDSVVSRLDRAKRGSGGWWSARCPSHDDQGPSLSLREGDKGGVIVKCHAGCAFEDIAGALESLGVDRSSLFPEKQDPYIFRPFKDDIEVARHRYFTDEGYFGVKTKVRNAATGKNRYVWYDANGNLGLKGKKAPLYGIRELLDARARRPTLDFEVFITEGEKDADNVRALGFIAVSPPGGVGSWSSEFNVLLGGLAVMILVDNDEAGRRHGEQVARSLQGTAESIKVVDLKKHWADLPEKGDVSDWINIDEGRDESRLSQIVEDTPEWTPDASITEAPNGALAVFTWKAFNALSLKPGEEIVYGLERGELGMLAAVTNLGKSTLIRDVSISLAAGRPFSPLVKAGKPYKVLLLDFESRKIRLQRDIRKMLELLTAEERGLVGENLMIVCDELVGDETLSLTSPGHFDALVEQALQHSPDLVIVDTLAASADLKEENSNAEAARSFCKPLLRLGREADAAVLFAHHIGKAKNEEGKAPERAYRARGASAYAAFCSVVVNLEATSNRDLVVLSLAKVKGESFEDLQLRLNRETRWFETLAEPENAGQVSNYDELINLMADGSIRKRCEINEALQDRMSLATIRRGLARAVETHALCMPKRGAYQRNGSIGSLP
jgi:hypothetical protein